MAHQWQFGADNVIERCTIAASSSDDPGYEAINLLNPFTFSQWKGIDAGQNYVSFDRGSSVPVDYVALSLPDWTETVASDLYVRVSDDGVTWTTVATIPADTGSTMDPAPRFAWVKFAEVTKRYFQVITELNVPLTLSVFYMGKSLTPTIGDYVDVEPPETAFDVELVNAVAENGDFLGRTILDRGVTFDATLEYITPSWVNTYGVPLIRAFQRRPCFINWVAGATDELRYPTFAWTKASINKPKNTTTQFMKMDFQLRGQR